jgi:SAM-dependent methyltransferase
MIASRIGIWVAVLAAILFIPWLIRFVFRLLMRPLMRVRNDGRRPLTFRERVLLRFQPHEFHPLVFAWFKTRLDAMFDELPEFLQPVTNVRKILDLGCGFGVAGAFLLEWFENAELYAVEPSVDRVRAAQRAFGPRGHVLRGAAPDFESAALPAQFDVVFSLDVLYLLNDSDLDLTLSRIRNRMTVGNYLLIRAPMKPPGFGSLKWNFDQLRRSLTGEFAQYRTVEQLKELIEKAGFEIKRSQMSGASPELHWFISTAGAKKKIEGLVSEPVAAVGREGK